MKGTPISTAENINNNFGLRTAHINFLGRSTINLAHDFKNHLAVINESAGLMLDLLSIKCKQRFCWKNIFLQRGRNRQHDTKHLTSELHAIQNEIGQLSNLIQQLGCFAHRLEKTHAVFEGHKALEEMRDILLKQAKTKGISLTIISPKTTSMIETNPTGFQLAVLCNLERVLAGMAKGCRIDLETRTTNSLFQICITSSNPERTQPVLSEEIDDQGFHQDIVTGLGGLIREQSGHGKHLVVLSFPLAK